MMNQKITLENTSDYMNGQGIFNILSTTHPDLPWVSKISGVDLDLDYYLNHSGEKVISRLVQKLLNTDKELTSVELIKLSNIIYNKYSDSWKRVFSAFELQYNPIWNKDYTEEFTDSEENSGENGSTITYGKVLTNGGTRTIEEDGTDNVEHTYSNYTETTEFGKDTTETKSFPTERKTETTKTGSQTNVNSFDNYHETDTLSFTNRKETNVKSGNDEKEFNYNNSDPDDNYKEEDTLSFTDRYTNKEKSGQESTEHNPKNYTTATDSWGQRTTKNRINAFNGGLVESGDTTTYEGGANGSSGSGSGGSLQGDAMHTRVVESGSYTDTTTYGHNSTPLSDKSTEHGSEKHTIKKSGKHKEKETFNNITDELSKTGSESHDITKTGTSTDTQTYNNVKDTVIESGSEQLKNVEDGDEKFKITGSKADNNTKDLTTTERNNLTETLSGSDSTTGTNSSNRTLTHSFSGGGNIGVTTTQQLLTSEVELRKMYSSLFDTVVYPDVDKVLVLGIFGDCHL